MTLFQNRQTTVARKSTYSVARTCFDGLRLFRSKSRRALNVRQLVFVDFLKSKNMRLWANWISTKRSRQMNALHSLNTTPVRRYLKLFIALDTTAYSGHLIKWYTLQPDWQTCCFWLDFMAAIPYHVLRNEWNIKYHWRLVKLLWLQFKFAHARAKREI